jgi:hypothetical protein
MKTQASKTLRLTVSGALALYMMVLAIPQRTTAQSDHDKRATIITFDVPGAGKTPGALNCSAGLLTGCYGTTPMQNNNSGQIVGMYLTDDGVYYGFLRNPDGKTKTFTAPGADTTAGDFNGTYPQSINSWGAVTGFYQGTDEVLHGFLRYPDGSYVEIDVAAAGTSAFQGTWPDSINEKGEVAGFYYDDNGVHGFLREPGGKITTFDNPNATGATFVAQEEGVNQDGAIVGWYSAGSVTYGYVREPDGTFHTVAPDGSAPYTLVGGINCGGASTGYYADLTGLLYGFLRTKDGTTTVFGASGPEASAGVAAFELNSRAEITGEAVDSRGANHGFLRFKNGKSKIFDASSPDPGTGSFQGTRPTTINDVGEIIGFYIDANNVSHGFIRYAVDDEEDNN